MVGGIGRVLVSMCADATLRSTSAHARGVAGGIGTRACLHVCSYDVALYLSSCTNM